MRWQPYPKYRDSGVEWLGKVPANWAVKPLKRVTTVNDNVLPETTDPDEEIEYVDISNVTVERGIEKTESMCFSAAPSRARRRVRDGDVIVSTVRTYLKAIAPIVSPPANLIVSTGFAVVRPQDDFDPSFARYSIQASYFLEEVIARSAGVSYPAINASELVGIKIAIPTMAEQNAIAIFLDRETAKLDTLIARQGRLIELLLEKRQALISHAVTKGLNPDAPMKDSRVEWLGEVPAHWVVVINGNIFKERIEPGISGLPVLKVSLHSGVTEGEDDEEGSVRVRKIMADKTAYKRAYAGDIAYNMMRAWQGAIGAVPVDGLVSPAYVVASPRNEINSNYFEAVFRTTGYTKEALNKSPNL